MRRLRPALSAAVLGLAAAGAADSAGAPDLAAIVAAFENLSAAEASVEVRGLKLESGRLTCLLESGRAAPVRAGAQSVGFFFEGRGRMEYQADDAGEAPAVLFNARRAASLEAEKSGGGVALRDRFTRLLWLSAGRALPELAGPSGPSLESAFRRQRGAFSRDHGASLAHALALQRFDAGGRPVVRVEMDGGRNDLVYAFDAVESRSESLKVLLPSEQNDPELRKFLWPTVLAEEPLGRDRRDPPAPRFRLTDVAIELSASAGDAVSLAVAETVVPMEDELSLLRFDLTDTSYYSTGRGTVQKRMHRVRGVRDGSGRELAFDHRRDQIVVALREPASAGRPLALRFEIEGDFLIRRGGDNFWELPIDPWFPQPELAGQAYSLRTAVRVPKPFVPFAPGATVRRGEDGGTNVVEAAVSEPVAFAVVLAGRYEVEEETRDGRTVRVATYAQSKRRAARALIDLAFEVIAFDEALLGPFPFREFQIIEINAFGFGEAPPGILFITREAFDPLLGDFRRSAARGVLQTFAHEIAHQYWGQMVKIPSDEEQWLSEAFAEYTAALFLKQARSPSFSDELEKTWRRRARYAAEFTPIPLANRLHIAHDTPLQEQIRQGLVYDKGALLLATIHRRLGDAAFRDLLRGYVASHRWSFGSTDSFAEALRAATGKDWGPFFDQYYRGTALPSD